MKQQCTGKCRQGKHVLDRSTSFFFFKKLFNPKPRTDIIKLVEQPKNWSTVRKVVHQKTVRAIRN